MQDAKTVSRKCDAVQSVCSGKPKKVRDSPSFEKNGVVCWGGQHRSDGRRPRRETGRAGGGPDAIDKMLIDKNFSPRNPGRSHLERTTEYCPLSFTQNPTILPNTNSIGELCFRLFKVNGGRLRHGDTRLVTSREELGVAVGKVPGAVLGDVAYSYYQYTSIFHDHCILPKLHYASTSNTRRIILAPSRQLAK